MRLKHLLQPFADILNTVYGGLKVSTKAAVARMDEVVQARPGTFDGSLSAMINRDLRRAEKGRGRMNTRGLPKGYSPHQARRARLLSRSRKHREAATLQELNAAQDFIDARKACERARASWPRVRAVEAGRLAGRISQSLASRMMPNWQRPTLSEFAASIRAAIRTARQQGRVPYVKPRAKAAPRMGVALHRSDGSIVVTPQPLPAG